MAARSSTTIAYEPPSREGGGGAETEILAKLQEKVGAAGAGVKLEEGGVIERNGQLLV